MDLRIAMCVPDAPFEIPLRCLLPEMMQGLVVTGRAISATREANGGSRHMATAMCLGEAAGVYAALLAGEKAINPSYQRIRKVLRAHGGLLSVEDALSATAADRRSIANPIAQFATV